MTDDTSIVLKPKEHFSEILLTQNTDELAKFMDEPLSAIAEAITGAMAEGPKAWMVMGGHVVQGMLKAKLFQQVSKEIKDLREKGKIPKDFADEKKFKYGAMSWVELLTIIDEETPDPDLLDALKAMFYAVNKTNATDGERIAAYQLFQIAKKLTSGQLLYLKACHEVLASREFGPTSPRMDTTKWQQKIGKIIGHDVLGLLQKDDFALVEMELITQHLNPDNSAIHPDNGRLTPLGLRLCKNIQDYQLEKSVEGDG